MQVNIVLTRSDVRDGAKKKMAETLNMWTDFQGLWSEDINRAYSIVFKEGDTEIVFKQRKNA